MSNLNNRKMKNFKILVNQNNKLFLNSLRNNGFELAPNTYANVSESYIEIGLYKPDVKDERLFASEISIYIKSAPWNKGEEMEINFGSSGSFSPENKASYWRTIHASSFLKNWDKFKEVCELYANKYEKLAVIHRKEIEVK